MELAEEVLYQMHLKANIARYQLPKERQQPQPR
jgi:hypothetical protein